MSELANLASAVEDLQAQIQSLRSENSELRERGRNQAPERPVPAPRKLPGVTPPAPLTFSMSNKGESWKLWRQQWKNYVTLSKLETASREEQVAMFQSRLSLEALKMYNQLSLPDHPTLTDIIEKMDEELISEINETYERYCFNMRSQQPDEPFDAFVADLKELSKTCGFKDLNDSLIRDRIVMGIRSKETQKQLLAMKKLTLADSIAMCKAAEATAQRMSTIQKPAEVHRVNRKHPSSRQHSPKLSFRKKYPVKTCQFCGQEHEMVKSKCPAVGQKCKKCGRPNHFASRCKKNKKLHELHEYDTSCSEGDCEDVSDIESLHVVNAVTSRTNAIYAELLICDATVKIQVDCGATVNVLPRNLAGDAQISKTSTILQMWNKAVVKPLGEARVPVCNPVIQQKYSCKFIIVPDNNGFVPLLGNKASQKMGLITVNSHRFKQVSVVTEPCDPISTFPDVFNDELGTLPGEVKLHVDSSVTPQIAPQRRVPQALKEDLKAELKKMCEKKIIAPVKTPTDWVSSIVVATKKSGDLRVCINPQSLNKALKRENYQLPVLEDFLPNLSEAKIFTTLDLKAGYWHVQLEESSSYLTTFSTPYGRYRFLRLPFGCNVSSEIFQRKLNEAIGDLPGILCVADDILLYGAGESETDAIKDHDIKLSALLQRCQEVGIRLNQSKMKLRQKSVNFLGHLVTSDGLKPDPSKCQAIDQMPPPEDTKGVQRLNGFVNYLAKFLPGLSDVMEPIRQLTKKDVPWNWGTPQQAAFNEIKKLVTEAPCLKYFDSSKPLAIQCDSSEKGLGAALLQENQPICYASRALTEVETRYAQIEKELLAIVFALERFHQYTFARHVTVSSDHQPLESIIKKPLFKAPRRLQGMLMRLQRYQVSIVYKPGREMHLADTLSRAFPPNLEGEKPEEEFEQINMVKYLPITNDRLSQIREGTLQDETMHLLLEVILKGWPEDKTSLPSQVHPYFHHRDELSAQDGLIFRGERVVIPGSLRKTIKERIHSSHLGIEGCLRRARECVFWPGMNQEIKDYIQRCEICSEYQTANQKETLMPHDVPDRPWSKIGTDLFSVGDDNYLITADYTSNFWEVDYLDNTESRTVIKKLKAHFARYGIPDQVISDNGPQFSSASFQHFTKDWDFEHLTISPGHSQSNGQVESAAKTAKKIIKKAAKAKSDIYLAILDHRNTPTQGMLASPAQVLMNRRTKTLLPTAASLLKPTTTYNPELKRLSKERQKKYYDITAKDLQPLQEGESVRMKPHQKGKTEWRKAMVTKRLDERSYEIESEGRTYRRNRVELKPVKTPTTLSEPSEPTGANTPATVNPDEIMRQEEPTAPETNNKEPETNSRQNTTLKHEVTVNREECTKAPNKEKTTSATKSRTTTATKSPTPVPPTPPAEKAPAQHCEQQPSKPVKTRSGRHVKVPAKYRD